uniref:hypothetical protein n=1 Tax=Yoonia sp. TaxID=2212373 RepID=UPI004048D739
MRPSPILWACGSGQRKVAEIKPWISRARGKHASGGVSGARDVNWAQTRKGDGE